MTIEQLLTRNLHEVFGEGDPARRRAAIDELYAEDAVFYGPDGEGHHGREAIDRIAGVIRASHPTFAYTETSPAQASHDAGRLSWVSGPAAEPPRYAGHDFILVRDGRIAVIYVFLDGEDK